MKTGVVDNSKKSIDPGKPIASFCMATRSTYDFIDDNPAIEFKTVDYTNNPLVIAREQGHDRHQQRHGGGSHRPGHSRVPGKDYSIAA